MAELEVIIISRHLKQLFTTMMKTFSMAILLQKKQFILIY